MSELGSAWPWAARDRYYEYEERSSAWETHESSTSNAWEPTRRMCVVDVTNFDEGALAVADRFRRSRPVIVNLQRADDALCERMVDFCAGLAYALDGRMHPIVDRLYLLTPEDVEVAGEEGSRPGGQAFFNRL